MFSSILIEPLWRSQKYEAISLHGIAVGFTDRRPIRDLVVFLGIERGRTRRRTEGPRAQAYWSETPVDVMDRLLRALHTPPQTQQHEDRIIGFLAAWETTGSHPIRAAKLSERVRSVPYHA